MYSVQGMWSGSLAKRGSLDNYHHGISQPCSISCYFWAIPFEVSLFYLPLTKHRRATGTGKAAEQLNCRSFKRCWLSQWLTTLPPSLAGLFCYPSRGWMISFIFFLLRTSCLSLFYFHHVCVASLWGVREILDYSNHSNQCLLFNAEFPE